VGSDAAAIKTSAIRRDDGWLLNGSKTWITSGSVADIVIVFAQTDPSKGHKGIAAFVVEKDTPGFTSREIKGKLGLRASNTAQLFLRIALFQRVLSWVISARVLR